MKRRWLVILPALLTAFASDSWGQSKQQLPPKEPTQASEQAAPAEQRGTEKSPIVVDVLPPKDAAEKAKRDADEQEKKSRYDLVLVILTGILAAIGFMQTIVFTWQGVQLKRTVGAAKEATELGNREFISTHRPKIIVYGMDVKLAGDDKPRHIHFRYINAGDTDASVTFIESRILWLAKGMVPAGIELHRHDTIKEPIPVPSGMNGFAITPDGVDFVTLVRSGRGGHDTAFCVGVVVYRDKNDIERRTGFCRRYDSERERWLKVEDEDYEYAY